MLKSITEIPTVPNLSEESSNTELLRRLEGTYLMDSESKEKIRSVLSLPEAKSLVEDFFMTYGASEALALAEASDGLEREFR